MSLPEVPQVAPKPAYSSASAETRQRALENARRPVSAARLVETFLSASDGYAINEMVFEIPLKHLGSQDTDTIEVTVRAVLGKDKVSRDKTPCSTNTALDFGKPIAAYLVGGPGSDNPPTAHAKLNDFYLKKGFQILYMDYRGTGSSHELRADKLNAVFTKNEQTNKPCLLANRKGGDEELAEYLTHFRQDNIVRDLEAVRLFLSGRKKAQQGKDAKDVKLTLIGQSYGGWVTFSYLSFYPHALDMVLLTGGVPPIGQTAETVYRYTFNATVKANNKFYSAHPEHVDIARRVVDWVHANTTGEKRIAMPGGGHLTMGRFLCLGRTLGTTDGDKKVAAALDACLKDIKSGTLSQETLKMIEGWIRFEERVLYCVLQESIYTEIGLAASDWAAERVAKGLSQFSWLNTGTLPEGARVTFYAEHVFRFHYDQFKSLTPLKGAAELLAKKSDWAPLFDLDQLSKNTVPIASLCYDNDIFVDARLSEATKANTAHMHQEVDLELMHTAVKDQSDEVLGRLWGMLVAAVTSSKGRDAAVPGSAPENAAALLAFMDQ